MAEWIALDPTEFDEVLAEQDARRFSSPFDTPEGVRGRYEEAEGRFVVEFQYIGLEVASERVDYGAFRFVLGEASQRLHRIEIDGLRLKESTRALDLKATEAVTDALKWLGQRKVDPRRPRPPRTANYQVALRVVERHQHELLGTLLL